MNNINRRDVLKASAVAASVAALPNVGKADVGKAEKSEENVKLFKAPKRTLKEVLMENQAKFNSTKFTTAFQNEITLAAVSFFVDNLVSKSLFGVQPLNAPEGNTYYLDFRHGKSFDKINILNVDGSNLTKDEIILVLEKLKAECIKKSLNLSTSVLNLEDGNTKDADSALASILKETEVLAEVLGVELALEVDRQNITNVSKNVGTTSVYDFNTAEGDTLREKFSHLYMQIAETSNVVHRKILHGGTNWILASADICAIFEMANAGFEPNEDAFKNGFGLGIQCVGTINNRWKLYKDPLFKNNEILMGYRGDTELCNGYIYSPYVMFADFSNKMMATDSCEQMTPSGGNFYAKIALKNMPGWNSQSDMQNNA